MKIAALSIVSILIVNPAWALGTPNHPPYRPQILAQIAQVAHQEAAVGHEPYVIFDLDDTLIDTRYRTLRILQEFAVDPVWTEKYPQQLKAISNLSLKQMAYDMVSVLASIGVAEPELLKAVEDFWAARFFTNEYCSTDQPERGAVAYAQYLRNSGARLVYLTGRNAQTMGLGTRFNLREHHFPLASGEWLIMNSDPTVDDFTFKKKVLENFRSTGHEVIAGFENEPRNINLFKEIFPFGAMVFVDTQHSSKPDSPGPSILWIGDFNHGPR